jgi:putative drug exporter of the RND superfamily
LPRCAGPCNITVRLLIPGVAIGRLAFRYRWFVLVGWAFLALALALLAPSSSTQTGQVVDLLPKDAPSYRAFAALTTHFAGKVGLSSAVIIVERAVAPLSKRDMDAVETFADQVRDLFPPPNPGKPGGVITVTSPKSLAFPLAGSPYVSADGKAAIVAVDLPYDFTSTSTLSIVDQLHALIKAHPFPSGIDVAVTGSAGFGRDDALANEISHHRTIVITIISVIVILLIVYRAPIAALIPLAGISAATFVALNFLALGHFVGIRSGTPERIFVLVLVYGAGVDYALLFISRYLEFLGNGRSHADSVALGIRHSAASILFSAATTIAGLAMLFSAQFNAFHNTGSAVVMALVVAAGASLTVVPAFIAVIGPIAFWPGRRFSPRPEETCPVTARADPPLGSPPAFCRNIWPCIADFVLRRPATILVVLLVVLAIPSIRGSRIPWMYNALATLKPTYSSIRGVDMVVRHWPIGEVAPFTVIVDAPRSHSAADWTVAYARVVEALRPLQDVGDVRGIGTPFGLAAPDLQNMAILLGGGGAVQNEFLSTDRTAMRFSVILNIPPLSLPAMEDLSRVREATQTALAKSIPEAQVLISGTTADMADVRAITQSDFHRIAVLSLAAIFLLVVALLRDVLLSFFMVAATVVTYLATLGITFWVFHLLGRDGLDWKLQIFIFVVLVAVGQDYNIFFAVRLAQELRDLPPVPAVRQALIHTGPVISCCGLIMAATLGSIMAGDITFLVETGFAFALGMLMDTFIVRPLLLPAFILVTRRTLRRAASIIR